MGRNSQKHLSVLSGKMPKTVSLLQDAYILFLAPIYRFFSVTMAILFRPSQFALESIHLGDRTNFVRQTRYFSEAAAYNLLVSTVTAYVTQFYFLSSERLCWRLTLGVEAGLGRSIFWA